MNGVIVIDKPADYTSFDVIAVVRKLTGQRRTGHTGTLNPNATGVLPVLLGSATKAQDLIPNHDKDYVADFRLGLSTDTLDIWGKVLSEEKTDVSREEIEAALPAFRGEITQIPPMYSAVKQNGQRLYDLARKGVEVERKGRQVTVYRLELNGFDRASQSGRLLVSCSKGTYVRTLIDDLGRALGTCAVMTALRRTAACGFTLDDCVTLEQLREMRDKGETEALLRPVDRLFSDYPQLSVSDAQAKRFCNGGSLDLSRTSLRDAAPAEGAQYRVYHRERGFLGLGKVSDGELKIGKLFPKA
ncbi:MAG: tRNA pseudouridine(55) synthase TruB [Ruminococcus sp.]|nr:tRNA pseudouridine(55) synthase TruB [Ruminococcus sp.]